MTVKVIGRKCWTKLKRSKKRRRAVLGNRWKGEEKKTKLYNTSDDEPWMHSTELTSALHPLSGPTQLSPTSHTKPISTLYWQAIQWGKRDIDGPWLAAFCSLSVFQKALALPDSWQDFVMEICDGQNSTKTLFPAFICRNDFMVWLKMGSVSVCVGEWPCECVCVWEIFMTGAVPQAHGL